jgi:hypothetical protein
VANAILQGAREVIRTAATQSDRFETDHLVLFIDKGLLARDAEESFSKQLDRGFAATVEYVQRPFAAAKTGVAKPTYYLTDRGGISHAGSTVVVLRAARVVTGPSIAIHETTHLLMMSDPAAPRNRDDLSPEEEDRWTAITGLWLIEGFANYVEYKLAPQQRIPLADLFVKGDDSTVDQEAREWLAEPRGRAVLPFVGSHGAPPNLLADRPNVAAPFYVLGHSLARYMVGRAGIAAIVRLYEEHTNGRASIEDDVRRVTGRDLAAWRQDWLRSLGVDDSVVR